MDKIKNKSWVIFALVAVLSISACTKPASTAIQSQCAVSQDTLCKFELTDRKDCYIFLENDSPYQKIIWSGNCSKGLAAGKGRLTIISSDKEIVLNTNCIDGKLAGKSEIISKKWDGFVTFENGRMNGPVQVRLVQDSSDTSNNILKGTAKDGRIFQGKIVRDGHLVFDGIFKDDEPFRGLFMTPYGKYKGTLDFRSGNLLEGVLFHRSGDIIVTRVDEKKGIQSTYIYKQDGSVEYKKTDLHSGEIKSENLMESPVARATKRGSDSSLLLLLRQHHPVDWQDIAGKTVLMYAIENGNPTAVNTILAFNPDLSIKDFQGHTVYELMNRSGNHAIIKILNNLKKHGGYDKALEVREKEADVIKPDNENGI